MHLQRKMAERSLAMGTGCKKSRGPELEFLKSTNPTSEEVVKQMRRLRNGQVSDAW